MTLGREGRLESCAESFGLEFLSMHENTFPFSQAVEAYRIFLYGNDRTHHFACRQKTVVGAMKV